jgi:tetratricopeptide (TPR) repeat protein/predicted Ser/Thr protein kinase
MGSGQSTEPTAGDPEATGAHIAGPVASTAPLRHDATGNWTPDPNLPTRTSDGHEAAPGLPRGATVRYFGDYEIEKELGRGGMGVVYRARQVSLNRPVALKMIKAGALADEAELRRFRNEAEAVALLDHAGIVPVYEVGEHDGQNYFSMKLVEGGNLADQLPTFQANPRAAAILMAETAEAVHHAHMRGILHRDLKPANILVDFQGRPHVTDFGLAKLIESDVELTASGAIMGTPSYMSPEQASGRRASITTATDIYGLGAILYALLTGKAPFSGDSLVDTLQAVKERPPEPPRSLKANVPRDLETICLKCLEKDPQRRYASAQALADDLRSWLDSRPIAARRVRAAERAWLWCKRKPAIAALAAAVVLAALGGTAAVIVVQTRANRLLEKKNLDLQASNTKLAEQRARAQDRETQAIDAVKRFGDVIEGEKELKNNPALDGLRKRLLNEPLAFFKDLRDRLQSDRDTTPESLARLAHASFDLGKLTGQIGDKQNALIAYREALPILQKLADANPADIEYQRDLAQSYNSIGFVLDAIGKTDEGLKTLDSALLIRQKLADANPTDTDLQLAVVSAHQNIGLILIGKRKPAAALKTDMAQLAILQKLADADPTDRHIQTALANCYQSIGLNLKFTGKLSEALDAHRSAEVILRKVADAEPTVNKHQSHLARCQVDIGILLRDMGNTAEAMKVHESALAISQKLADANPTVTDYQDELAGKYANVGVLLARSGKAAEAQNAFLRALKIRQKLADDNPTVLDFQGALAGSHDNLGIMLRESGEMDEARKAGELALAIRRRLARERPDSTGFMSALGANLNNLGLIDLNTGRFEEASVWFREAIEWQRKALAPNPSNPDYRQFLANHLYNLGTTLREQRKLSEAITAYREVIRLKPNSPLTHYELGDALRDLGKLPEAFAEYREAIRLKPDSIDFRYNLGNTFLGLRKPDEAIIELREVIRLKPDFAEAHCNLGHALRAKGEHAESLAEFRRGHELGSKRPGWSYPSGEWVAEAERSAAIAQRLPAVLKGEDKPGNAAEGLAFAQLCYNSGRYAAATRLWADALAADAKLTDDRQAAHRYNAACAAAAAASGAGKDERSLDDTAKAKLRQQAFEWLKAELAAWGKLLESAPPEAKASIAQILKHWQEDTDLAGVRGDKAIEALPEADRAAWRALWADVSALLEKARAAGEVKK